MHARRSQRSQCISLVICFLWYEPSQMVNELIKHAVTQQLNFFLNCAVSPVYVHPHHRRKTLQCSALIASTKAVELVSRYDGHSLLSSAHSLTFFFFPQSQHVSSPLGHLKMFSIVSMMEFFRSTSS